jgi:hypothetical protein
MLDPRDEEMYNADQVVLWQDLKGSAPILNAHHRGKRQEQREGQPRPHGWEVLERQVWLQAPDVKDDRNMTSKTWPA